MFGLLSGFKTQIMGGMLIIILLGGAGGYWYFDYTQSKIAILNQNIATLESNTQTLKSSIKQQNDSIIVLDNERIRDQQTVVDLSIKFGETQFELDRITKQAKRHNQRNLARKKPGLVEKIINRGTKRVFSEFEMISDPSTYRTKPILGERLSDKD